MGYGSTIAVGDVHCHTLDRSGKPLCAAQSLERIDGIGPKKKQEGGDITILFILLPILILILFSLVVFYCYFLLDQKVAKKSSRPDASGRSRSGKISLGQHSEKASLRSEMQALFACC